MINAEGRVDMSAKLRAANTETDNLISNLRGEVGEIIESWVLMRGFRSQAASLATGDLRRDIENQALTQTEVLIQKLKDETVSRLSELAEEKVGRLNFFFTALKLGHFNEEAKVFKCLIETHRLRRKRNRDIAHKELPERWIDHRDLWVPYRSILRCIAAAVRLMKRIDRSVIGPAAPYLWREARKRRGKFQLQPRVAYLLLPHLNLSPKERCEIVQKEIKEGRSVLVEFPTTINGIPTTIPASRTWGVLVLDDALVGLSKYPLSSLANITFDEPMVAKADEPTTG